MRQPEENIITIKEGLEDYTQMAVDYIDVGKQVNDITVDKIEKVVSSINDHDVVVVVVGENPLRYDRKGMTTGENVARSSLNLGQNWK